MASVEELNKAIEVIRNHCKNYNGYCWGGCPFYINCAPKGNIEPPCYWEDIEEEEEKL